MSVIRTSEPPATTGQVAAPALGGGEVPPGVSDRRRAALLAPL